VSDSVTIELTSPIKAGSELIERLTFRQPKAKDLRGISLTIGDGGFRLEMDSVLKLAARCSGQTDHAIGELSLKDMTEVGKAVMDFILPSQETGETGLAS